MGKTAANQLWEQMAARIKGTPLTPSPAKRTPSPKKKAAAPARAAPARATPARATPARAKKPAVKKEVLSPENTAALCRNQPPPCPPGCVQWMQKSTGKYLCKAKPTRSTTKSAASTPANRTPTGILLPNVSAEGSWNVERISPTTSPATTPSSRTPTGILAPHISPEGAWNVNVVPVRPPKVPKFAGLNTPIVSSKVPVFEKPLPKARKNVIDLPVFAPNITWAPMAPPKAPKAPKARVNTTPAASYNIEEGLLSGLFEFEEQIEQAVDQVIQTPAAESVSERLRKELLRAGASASNVDAKFMDREDVKIYISLKSLTPAEKLREMSSEVQRIHAAVNAIVGSRQKITSANVPAVNDLISNHNLCKLVNHSTGKLVKTTGEHTLTYLRELCRLLNLRGYSSSTKGELCFMIAEYVCRSEREYASFFLEPRGPRGQTEYSARLSNITRALENVPRAAKGTAAPKVKSECSQLTPPCPDYCVSVARKDGKVSCRAKAAKSMKVL
jgi:hypothetical protein